MEDKPLTESINKQYSKYGSLRMKEKESKIELCNAEDPIKFLTRIDSSIKTAKAKVKQSIDNSTICEDYESSYEQFQDLGDPTMAGTIPMVNLDKIKPTVPTGGDTPPPISHTQRPIAGHSSALSSSANQLIQSTRANATRPSQNPSPIENSTTSSEVEKKKLIGQQALVRISAAMNQYYLGTREQDALVVQFGLTRDRMPRKDKFFLDNGSTISYFATLAPSIVAWRAGFRGFNLFRYGRGRSVTLLLAIALPANGGLYHSLFCQNALTCYYRSENKWRYGMNSALAHQAGALLTMGSGVCTTFIFAQRNGLIPSGHIEKLSDGFNQPAFRYFWERIKPRCGGMAATFAVTSILMFFVGVLEYEDSCKVLAKMNRKTLCQKED